jgi:mRNA-degrading endonuclease toxin of MazEF toxin-antitoxin module
MQWSVFGFGVQRKVMVLVISSPTINQTLEHVTVLPVVESGEQREVYPNEAVCAVRRENGGSTEVTVLVHQVRTLRQSALGPRVGTVITASDRRRILDALEVQLGVSIIGDDQKGEDNGREERSVHL